MVDGGLKTYQVTVPVVPTFQTVVAFGVRIGGAQTSLLDTKCTGLCTGAAETPPRARTKSAARGLKSIIVTKKGRVT